MGVCPKRAWEVMRVPSCESNQGWSRKDSGTAAGGCTERGTENTTSENRDGKSKKRSVTQFCRNTRPTQGNSARQGYRKAKASYRQPSAAC